MHPIISPSRLVAACACLLAIVPGQAFAQSKSKSKTTAPAPYSYTPKPKMVCEPGYYQCSDSYGNCCKFGWTCTPDGMCAPPAAGAGGGDSGGKSVKVKPGLKFNNEGTFQLSGSGGSSGSTSGKTWKPKAAVPSSANIAQWPGFRMTDDGGSEVMIEFSKATAPPTEHKAAGSVTYVFKGAHIVKSNNQNPLITVHFNTPVASARLVPKGPEVHLVIDYRAGANASASSGMRPGVDGTGQQFFVKFPSGAWLPKGAEDEAPAPTQKLKAKGKSEPEASTPTSKTDSGSKTGPSP